MSGMIAIVRVRGKVNISHEIKKTLDLLNLPSQNSCTVVKDTPVIRGMCRKVHGYVTFGTVSDETIKLLETKKSKKEHVYHLSPPLKGFGRKGIKRTYQESGALGDRKDDINDLLKRMVH
ncbi:MAG TPA: uL30 family ribosomal protein [Acidobacteriota bacterium]|nr:uL30 family ribosomal protein [Acidobacteriota bacterium]